MNNDCGLVIDLIIYRMKRVVTYLIVIASLISFEGWSQKPGDLEPIAGKQTFEGRRVLRKEKKIEKNTDKYAAKLFKSGPKETANRFIGKKSGGREYKAHQRKVRNKRRGER